MILYLFLSRNVLIIDRFSILWYDNKIDAGDYNEFKRKRRLI